MRARVCVSVIEIGSVGCGRGEREERKSIVGDHLTSGRTDGQAAENDVHGGGC